MNYSKFSVQILVSIQKQPYAWPGGYERHGVTDDGGLLCSRCVREEWRNIVCADPGDGWYLAGETSDAELEEGNCDHCSRAVGMLAYD